MGGAETDDSRRSFAGFSRHGLAATTVTAFRVVFWRIAKIVPWGNRPQRVRPRTAVVMSPVFHEQNLHRPRQPA